MKNIFPDFGGMTDTARYELFLPILFAVGWLIGLALVPFGFPLFGVVLPIVILVVFGLKRALRPHDIDDDYSVCHENNKDEEK